MIAVSQTVEYQRAEQMLTWNAMRHVTGDQVAPTWYPDSTRFWYRVMTPRGFEFMTVNAVTGSRSPLFENGRLAAALSRAADTAVVGSKLPFQTIAFENEGKDERRIRVKLGNRGFTCELATYTCSKADTLPTRTRYSRSPNAEWDAFASGNNLWVRRVGSTDSVQLTTDGAPGYAYGVTSPSPTDVRLKRQSPPQVTWSPDSKRLVVPRIDERGVGKFVLYSSTTSRPAYYEYPYALPGDSIVQTAVYYVVDVAARTSAVPASPATPAPSAAQGGWNGTSKRIETPPQPYMSFYIFGGRAVQWGPASDRVYFTQVDRGPKHVQLMVADALGGAARQIIADSSKSYVIGSVDIINGRTNWRPLKNGDVIWFSERDGWGHLYHVGADGAIKHQITSGDWVVTGLLGVNEALGRVYFTARGREANRHPEYDFLYSAALDGTSLTLLTPEDAQHLVTAVPGSTMFLDTYSRVDSPPVTVLRSADGRVMKEIEKADISALKATGWRPGEVFRAKARDGVTEISGVIYKPSNFDSTKTYPVIDHIYPGPLITPVAHDFYPTRAAFSYSAFGQVQALAELGFIVVEIDALGNTARNKAVYTTWYGNMGDNGIPDHVAAIKQLGTRFRWMDLSRIGIYGHSGGGFSSTDAMLRYPDFYKVAVSTSGNHDNRTYYHGWGERFQGLLVKDTLRGTDNFAAAANKTIAGNLKGKLFLIHGDLDDNVHPAHTLALVDALVKANKTFDMLILPDATHDLTGNVYVIRRTWDYFVEHLMGARPPADYTIAPPPQ
ncbi:MAG TPA: DPP IV N-terminal domain-containing protein [Gemmatimonadaceae bacterium]|nr:DPP IV N-terminal domain-containing protein [Gemmatimonadaceae bacterium]